MKLSRWVPLSLIILVLSCERAIDIVPPDREPALVVEASIENDQYPTVFLTRSFNVFSNLSVSQLSEAFVHDAVLTISNGLKTHTLKEYQQSLPGGLFIYYYSIDSAQIGSSFKGELGESYTLSITSAGKQYTATTTIPVLANTINSLYYEENIDKDDSSKVALYGSFYDPPGFGNYTRYFTSVNGEPFFAGLNSVYDDQVIDGKTYNVQIEKGVDRNSDIDFDNYALFTKGDSIRVKYCNINKQVFDFWRTMEFSYSSIGNPFSSPTKVKGNISNGALGYFGGYAVQYSMIVVHE